jgi:hypothetical protein
LRLSHEQKNFGLLGKIERGFAGKSQRVTMLALPGDKTWQHFPCSLAVSYEIVVDEIDYGRIAGPCQHGVEFGSDLWTGPIERNVFARIRRPLKLVPERIDRTHHRFTPGH